MWVFQAISDYFGFAVFDMEMSFYWRYLIPLPIPISIQSYFLMQSNTHFIF